MSDLQTLYITSHNTGELMGVRKAQRDIKQPGRLVVPPYHTPNVFPGEVLGDNEYWALLGSNNKPVRNYLDGEWVKKKRHQKVTAYLKSNGTESKEFGDKTLVTDNYTLESPSTQWDEWNGTAWVTNQSNKHIAEYNQADSARRAAYREVSDPLYMEALRQESRGLTDEAAEYRAQADAAVELIKLNLPWPEPLTN